MIIIGAVRHTAHIEIRYVQFARILLYWTGISRLVGRLGFRSKGQCQLSVLCTYIWKFDHVLLLLKELHWLRVPERIAFWLAVLAYRCQHNTAPLYLTVQLQQASNVGYRQRLRSSSSAKLDVPRTEHMTIGGRAFSSTAAHVWNSLPRAVQSSESLDIFWRRLKTELFERSYNWHHACRTTLLLPDSLSRPQPWSLSTIMLLWHSFLIIIRRIICFL